MIGKPVGKGSIERSFTTVGVTALALAAAWLNQPAAAFAQSLGQSCVRFDTSLLPKDRVDAHLASQSAQLLMDEISKQISTSAFTVRGALVFKGTGQVVVLWLRGDFVCSNGPYERALFDRAERSVFGLDA